jgi:hypothetical protein
MEQLRWIRMLAYHERSTLSDGRAAESRRAARSRAYRRLWAELRCELLRAVARSDGTALRSSRFRDLSANDERSFVLCAVTGRSIAAMALADDDGDGLQCRYWRDGAAETYRDVKVAFESNEESLLLVDDGGQRRAFGSTADVAAHLMRVLLTRPPAAESQKRRG